jgi:hypothetical protein
MEGWKEEKAEVDGRMVKKERAKVDGRMERREGGSGWKDGKRQFDMYLVYRYTRWRRNAS